MKGKLIPDVITQLTDRDWVKILAYLFIGLLGISIGEQVPENWFLLRQLVEHGICVLATVGIYHVIETRNVKVDEGEHLLAAVDSAMNTQLDSFKKEIKNLAEWYVAKYMPSQIRLSSLGPSDVTARFDVSVIVNGMLQTKDSVIRFLKIYLPFNERFEKVFLESIMIGNNSIQIILCNPHAKEALRKRALALGVDHRVLKESVLANLIMLSRVYHQLPEGHKHKLQVKLHNSFIAVSLTGYGDCFWCGHYLCGRIATEGINERYEINSAKYNELMLHFTQEWNANTSATFDLGLPFNPKHE
ncbi:hypothetical protein ACAW74_22875 [Fibrella sp. WM1]|uniref:hypothetical protein n=1 Tax=Fibrella musci TaxID=3242485 RepID=UPI0035215AF6